MVRVGSGKKKRCREKVKQIFDVANSELGGGKMYLGYVRLVKAK